MFNIERFLEAQNCDNMYETALQEVKEGWKRSHWIWYVFPQMDGLGSSPMSKEYGIGSLLAAKAYWDDNTLRRRLDEITAALYEHNGEPMEDILGRIDAVKVRSCMTLFNYVDKDANYYEVIRDCFDGEWCKATRERMDKEYEWIRRSALTDHGVHADDKAFMESFSTEADEYTFDQRLGTLIDLFMRGERMKQMVSHYLWSRDTSHYRITGVESTIKSYLASICGQAYENASNSLKEALDLYLDRLDGIDEVMYAAESFDTIMYELTKNQELEGMMNELKSHSLAKER